MNSGRFAVSMHILTLLARENRILSSGYIANSININPVLVRKEIVNLRNHRLIDSREGKYGGSRLARPAQRIFLSDIYRAVRPGTILGHSKNKPNPKCPVGRQINRHLNALYTAAENALMANLEKTTLSDFVRRFK